MKFNDPNEWKDATDVVNGIKDIFREAERILSKKFQEPQVKPGPTPRSYSPENTSLPPSGVEVIETGANVEVYLDLPGVELSAIEVTLEDNKLIISGERKRPYEPEVNTKIHTRRVYGKFRQPVVIPNDIEIDKIDASLKSGVLKIVLPKKKDDSKVRIHIKPMD
jgi:HSP20 family molecular chaperone IbpA